MKRTYLSRASVLGVFALCLASPAGAQPFSKDRDQLRVMTYNVDEGTDYLEVQNARSLTEFLVGVGQIVTNVRATNPPARMQALARQVLSADPDLVSLQELARWSTGPFNPITQTCGPVTLEFDLLQELLDALAMQGGHYKLVVERQQLSVPPTPGLILPSTFLCAQVTNKIAILVRTDMEGPELELSNVQSGQYRNEVFIPIPGGSLPSPRAWVSVDGTFKDKPFRFIGTHLESVVASVRELQGAELRNGPANTPLPVILAMDSNAQAFPLPQDPTYVGFIAAGFKDVWTEVHPFAPGLTCCQAPRVNNPVSQLTQRIDLILTRGPLKAKNILLFGADTFSRTRGGLWPSDHAGVAAQFAVDEEDEK